SSFYGPDFYRLPRNQQTLTLHRESWQAPSHYPFGKQTLTPFRQQTPLQWTIK
ncbi:MAG TPA: dihydroorotase, partial [Methylococcaceae bacterium]|nr:dihydroorotase [Methylococcaceae bacterium]